MNRLFDWLWRRFRPAEGRLTLVLLILAVLMAAAVVMEAEWVPGDEMFGHVALVAFWGTRLLGRRRLPSGWTALLMAIAGVIYVGWGVTHLHVPLWGSLAAAWRQDWPQAWVWLKEAGSRLDVLAREVVSWGGSLIGKEGSAGSIVSLSWMALLIWGAAAFSGWSLARRRHPVGSFFPLIVLAALSVYLGDEGYWYFLFFMAFVVMLVPTLSLHREEYGWDARKVPYSDEFRFDAALVAGISAAIFVLAAMVLPNLQVRALSEWFWRRGAGPRQAAGEVLERTFPGARQVVSHEPASAGASLPRVHLLGGRPELGEMVVMLVTTDDPPPMAEGSPYAPGVRHETLYWRGTVHAEYVGPGWLQGTVEETPISAYTALGLPDWPGRRPLRQEFTLLVPHGDTLYAAGDPHSIDQPVTMLRLPEGGDLVAIEGPADHYHVLSMVPQVSAEELSAASDEYPDQIQEVYLALPNGLPARVVDLAQEVVAGLDTPYARALALENYLRSFPYDLDVARAPQGRDVVDYFLFDLQRGYCDYFATSMVVMARSVGIPARLASGYAMGSYSVQRGAYVVTEQSAHAWPELYFPEYGWIPFEPTSGFSALERDEPGASPALPAALPERSWWVRWQVEARLIWLHWRWWVLLGVMVILVLGARWRRWRHWRLPALDEAGRVALSYVRLRGLAPGLGVKTWPGDTPAEFADNLQQGLSRRRPRIPWLERILQRTVQKSVDELSLLIQVYEQVSYAPIQPHPDLLQQAWREGRHLRRRLWRMRVLSLKHRDDLGSVKFV